jgi:prepilin-type N-terminal cleavage/methylation domain-containing protein
MQRRATVAGYTLIEIIVALLVFAVGVLALAASSGVVIKATANNATRELATRTAVSRIETIASQCATASSGRETRRQMESEWIITKDPTTTEVAESVRCPAMGRVCTASYRATIWCPP